MKLSTSFTKTLKNSPKDETARSAGYLLRAGYIYKEMAGAYDFLPLGLRVLENIKNVVREELNNIGCQELQMTSLQNPELWKITNRWDDQEVDIWFKTKLSAGGEVGLAPTHEEPITNLMKSYISSYKDLPVYAYQFQTKFRNELRAKSGILRGREFLMKDLYSFSADEESHNAFYKQVESAYTKIFDRLGIGDCTYETFASGGIFSKFSHEFQTMVEVGEDTVYHNDDFSVVMNEEVVVPEVLSGFKVTKEDLTAERGAEVANIFTLKNKYSGPLKLQFTDKNGEKKDVIMGCYGIGISRVMGVIAEKLADDKGLIWPEEVAPYKYYIVAIGDAGTKLAQELEEKYPELVLLDDRDVRPGEKFADSELMGIPHRIVISDKTLAENSVEYTSRQNGETKLLTIDTIKDILMKYEKDN